MEKPAIVGATTPKDESKKAKSHVIIFHALMIVKFVNFALSVCWDAIIPWICPSVMNISNNYLPALCIDLFIFIL